MDANDHMITPDRAVFTVTDLTRQIKLMLEDVFPNVWVEGEVSNFVHHTSGHMYFTLKDDGAQIPVVMFRHVNAQVGFEVKNGLQVVIGGRVSVFEKRGSYQLYAERMEPKGIGALQLRFLQLKEKLEKEGLFDESRKRKLPILPRTIGIITSPTGAAIRDMLTILERRFSNAHIVISPVRVQGEGACDEIAQALDDMNEYAGCEVLILARGGGSIEDLWAFNEECVARAIARSRIPVISAIGHEIDYTISDFVSDLRAPTPSAAAELVLRPREEWMHEIRVYMQRGYSALETLLNAYRMRLTRLCDHYALREPVARMRQYMQRIDELMRSLEVAMTSSLERKQLVFQTTVRHLDILSPLAILGRGYSITYKEDGKTILREKTQIHPGDRVRTRLASGEFIARVEEV